MINWKLREAQFDYQYLFYIVKTTDKVTDNNINHRAFTVTWQAAKKNSDKCKTLSDLQSEILIPERIFIISDHGSSLALKWVAGRHDTVRTEWSWKYQTYMI